MKVLRISNANGRSHRGWREWIFFLLAGICPCPALVRFRTCGGTGGHSPSPWGEGRGEGNVCRRSAQSGVALVVTLILLSVITFMAIAFLVLSHREQSSTVTAYDQTIALQAANSGLERAQAVMLANIITSANLFNVGPNVSTNFINPYGFVPGMGQNPTNVNYDTTFRGTPLTTLADQQRNIANLQYLARAPVFITNRVLGSNEFRYYLDLNRNGRFDPSGLVVVTNGLNQPVPNGNNGYLVENVTGDPQWVGELEFADRPHSADNRFMFRYAYQIVPISETMDVNYIHNQAANPAKATLDRAFGGDFYRNQGIGTWEINLASFLYDLNTNILGWGGQYLYQYNPGNWSFSVRGNAFVDACSILAYRYGGNAYRQGLAAVGGPNGLFTNGPTHLPFATDQIDDYTAGPVVTTSPGIIQDPDLLFNRSTFPWPGSDNTNHFFTPQDLFDPNKTASFATRLLSVSTNVDTYDRYTFSRLVSQLGTESSPEPPGKMNLNYDNLVQTNSQGIVSATNFLAWRPIDFFTNAATRLLTDAGYSFGVTNIQVWPNNFYTPSVHRLLQLAANIYDSTTNRTIAAGVQYPYFPSVFRPIFRRNWNGRNWEVFIAGYREVTNHLDWIDPNVRGTAPIFVDLTTVTTNNVPPFQIKGRAEDPTERGEQMVWGIPLVIGAKKGFPNFNEFSMQTYIYVSRLLEFRRDPALPVDTSPVKQTNQMYVVAVTNAFGIEAWNSYLTPYPRPLRVIAALDMKELLTTNITTAGWVHSNSVSRGTVINLPAGSWQGWTNVMLSQGSFLMPLGTNNSILLTNSTYIPRSPWFVPQTHIFEQGQGLYVPRWIFNQTTRLKFILFDTAANRIVDYVNLQNTEYPVDVMAKLGEGANCGTSDTATYNDPASQWCTNRMRNSPLLTAPTYGILNQIGVGLNGTTDWNSFSRDPYAGRDSESAVDGFRYNLYGWGPIYPQDQGLTFHRSNVFYAPFDPYRPIYIHTTWQANDPLVHYTLGDLVDLVVDPTNRVNVTSHNPPLDNLGVINNRFEPWGGNPMGRSNPDIAPNQVAAKDPLITRPDFWDFPTNKFPNPGWLGRVHRGTPWQTVFLKSTNILLQTGSPTTGLSAWQKWTGNGVTNFNIGQISFNVVPPSNTVQDAIFSLPTNDWRLMDLFTAAPNENAARGRVSVNQTNLATWSAVLTGVNVLTDATNNSFILPAGVYDPLNPPPLVRIVNGINATRTRFPKGSFQRLGDILATPELTIASPYISTNGNAVINDAVVERIPQQVMGLLRGGEPPRFVIYSWGQTLKPAARGVLQSGQFVGMCTNYTITAEVATRAVVRVDGTPSNPRTVVESFNVLPPD